MTLSLGRDGHLVHWDDAVRVRAPKGLVPDTYTSPQIARVPFVHLETK